MQEMEVSEHIIHLIRNLYTGSKAEDALSKKGCILSPILFNIYSEAVLREAFL